MAEDRATPGPRPLLAVSARDATAGMAARAKGRKRKRELRRLMENPDYVVDWRANAGRAVMEPPPYVFRGQTEADLTAARWNLMAWVDPRYPQWAVPFWLDMPTVGSRVADTPLKRRVDAVEVRAELGRPAKVGAGCQDAEAATQRRHAGGIGPVGGWPAWPMRRKTSSVERSKTGSQSKSSRPATLIRSLHRHGVFLACAWLWVWLTTEPSSVDRAKPLTPLAGGEVDRVANAADGDGQGDFA